MEAPIVVLDDARGQRLRCYLRPSEIVSADDPAAVGLALDAMGAAVASGRHVAGYFSYELGYRLEARLTPLRPRERTLPLLWFGIFDAPQIIEKPDTFFREQSRGRAYAGPLAPEWSRQDYAARFRRVRAFIEAGDVYQVNLSFRARFHVVGEPLALYSDLRARSGAGHCAYIDDGKCQLLSLSPELFFAISADGRIAARPMKGTAARGTTPAADAAARAHLRASDKERAENLMIVDLLRNDLGRIAEVGSIAADELFAVETYPTVHQMVSTITAQRKSGVRPRDIVQALFPCGSVTGAPKIRAMEIIAELESSPRGVYCGAIGYFAPDGSASFNVAIRTLTISGNHGELGVGGAVVYDSRAEAEYAECLLKARYFEAARQPLQLIETLRWSPVEGFVRLDRHLARIAASARVFGIAFRRDAAVQALAHSVIGAETESRVRLLLSEDGNFDCSAASMEENSETWRYIISPHRVLSGDLLARHKTNRRALFEAELARAAEQGSDEVIFINERDEITEGSRSNVFVRLEGGLVTPPLSAGLLNGCLRQELIEVGQCAERRLLPADLARAEAAYFGNSLRGLIPAVIAGS